MKKVFIKYNPYKIETEFTVDGKNLAQNSKIGEWIVPGKRLQEWIEELPHALISEYNDKDFDITFHGTLLDYEDLTDVFTQAYNRGELTAKIDRIPAKETEDKEILIDEVFKEIQAGPFDELRDADIVTAFQNAKSSDFEVCVVATMSAGKSTLINAMLGKMLMPSKQEACTAIITRVKDTDSDTWQAEVYNKDNELIETHADLSYETMDRLNSDKDVSTIKIAGDIPFVTAEDVSLVLIDTPGPNNARDDSHGKIQDEFLKKSSKSLVLYIMEGTFGSDDDNRILNRVAESMKVGGKQSKDRFIFVVNKMDGRSKNDGSIAQTLERVRSYLELHGITDPNLFPAAALPALNIRLLQSGADMDEDTLDETEMKVRKFNRKGNEDLHLEAFASLPASIRGKINQNLSTAEETDDTYAEALIHTGIPSIEAAIRQYVQKYAKTAKIKNIADTFTHKIEEVKCFEMLKGELDKNRAESEQIAGQIALIRQKVDDANAAKKFKDSVNDAVVSVNDEARDVIETIIEKYQEQLSKRVYKPGIELKIEEVDSEIKRLERFVRDLEPDFQSDLNDLIQQKLVKTSETLIEEYRKKIQSLTEDIDSSVLAGIKIEPLKLIGGSIKPATIDSAFAIQNLSQEKQVEDGREWVANTDKKWYKPWTWFQDDGYYRKKYKDVQYVPADKLAQTFLAPIKDGIFENGSAAQQYALKQANFIAVSFNQEFKRLDDVLKGKLSELEDYAAESDRVEERIHETEQRTAWLKGIQAKVASILEV